MGLGQRGFGALMQPAFVEQRVRQQAAERQVQADPFLQNLTREFGATVMQESIRPV